MCDEHVNISTQNENGIVSHAMCALIPFCIKYHNLTLLILLVSMSLPYIDESISKFKKYVSINSTCREITDSLDHVQCNFSMHVCKIHDKTTQTFSIMDFQWKIFRQGAN